MFQDLVIRVKTRQFQMYNEYFSFFHSNSINKILTSKKIDQVILYRDLQFFDDQTQYLKRAYYQTQAFNRIKKLISYYEKNMTPPSPILLTVQQYQYLDTRNRKILKLCIMKEKSQALGQKQKRKSFMQSNGKGSNTSALVQILPKLDETNLQNMAESDRDQSQEQSYDSDVHDVFQNFKQKARGLFSDGNDHPPQYREVLAIRNVKESELVINFKTANEPPSDFNNCQNQPKVVVSQPSSSFSGLKFSKSIKQQQNILPQQSFQSYQNQNQQPLEQQNFYPQSQNTNPFQQGYPVQQNQSGFGSIYQQPQNQQIQSNMPFQPIPQPLGPSIVVDNTSQFINSYSNSNNQVEKASSPKKVPGINNNPSLNNIQNYQSQQASTTTNSSNERNTFTSMLANSNNYNSMGNNFNLVNNLNMQSGSSISSGANQNTLNSATSPNKKGKLSFMEYYHSVPVKNPTNILEKYMKRKK